MIEENLKKSYLSPKLEVLNLEMENGFAAGSAKIVPPSVNGNVQEEWTEGTDENHVVDW